MPPSLPQVSTLTSGCELLSFPAIAPMMPFLKQIVNSAHSIDTLNERSMSTKLTLFELARRLTHSIDLSDNANLKKEAAAALRTGISANIQTLLDKKGVGGFARSPVLTGQHL